MKKIFESFKTEFINEKKLYTVATDDINLIKMIHQTTSENIKLIKKNGFEYSNNSMYGQGVYFSNIKAYGDNYKNFKTIEVELKPHQELIIQKDIDVPNVIKQITGKDLRDINFRKNMIKSGYGSMRFHVDKEIYTVVFNKKLIKIKS